MRILTLTVLSLALTGSAALAMPGATVGIPVGSPDPFGTMRRDAEPPATSLDEPGRRIERRPRTPRLSRHRAQKARR
ncbi:hypothetical protein ASG52_02655 [Methylobacterium sp. Leaf456]|uniref:hypothetical protein n=1 Tax=Methylobacterium sp. Leaf456 TaxID=1736382 RepID=UPI0006FE5FD0|nr:hypothetical protein [Methylobacterium sp. Leaf456]KQT56996.1 hypothetical protein ASG52_02655 [Methylobacterium sp. Leaf456]